MNVALIIAGGSGVRTQQDIPKQFLNVFDKPIIIYTLERFQHHPEIDAIEVVCLEGWHEVLKAYAKQFNLTKLKWVTSGGATVQESIKNGIVNLKNKCKEIKKSLRCSHYLHIHLFVSITGNRQFLKQ